MEIHLVKDLAIVMGAAGAMTLLCHRLKQPVVIGYLLAGLLIGPYTPPFTFVTNLNSIHTMAELGLVFLLFSLGLEFNLPKIRRVGASAGLAAVLEVIGMTAIGYGLGRLFGWSAMDSLFLGAILSISSTTIIVKVFMDFKMIHEKFVQVVFGILVLEDIVAVAFLSILSGLGSQGGPDAGTILFSFVRIGIFIVLFLVVGLLLIPRLMQWVAGFKSKEVLGIVTIGLCLSGALLASYYELSIALGAFLAGAVLAASKQIHDIEEWIHPVRDFFSAIFFVSAGMLIQPELLWLYRWPIAIVTLVTIVGKVISGAMGSFMAGYDMKTSARVGMSLAQIGEFSFVIASLGLSLKVTSDFLYPLAVTVSSLTTLATPYLIRNSDRLVEGFAGIMPPTVRSWMDKEKPQRPDNSGGTIVSKYWVRLAVYVALFIALIGLLNAVSVIPPRGSGLTVAIWIVSGMLCLPLFTNISKYANHIILLLVTRSKLILHYLNIHLFYNTLNAATMTLLALIFIFASSQFMTRHEILFLEAFVLFFTTKLMRNPIIVGKEWLESRLDQITGLATSEPTRQAIMKSGESTLLLVDITDQVTLTERSPAANKTIRDLQLRKKTGATIVAIYRNGSHLANPMPDLTLLTDDILILMGNKDELEKGKELLG
jgi:CPA2 family monovalent cation:H+ antiporter-2